MIQVKSKSNFSFEKLARNFNKVIDKTLVASAKDSEEKTKFNIDNSSKGSVRFDELSKATVSARDRGIYWEGNSKTERIRNAKKVTPVAIKKGLKNKGKDMPLIYTGKLYNSIKAKDKKLSMAKYGKEQNDGYSVSGNAADWIVPPRPFIEKLAGEKAKKTFNEQIKKNLKK